MCWKWEPETIDHFKPSPLNCLSTALQNISIVKVENEDWKAKFPPWKSLTNHSHKHLLILLAMSSQCVDDTYLNNHYKHFFLFQTYIKLIYFVNFISKWQHYKKPMAAKGKVLLIETPYKCFPLFCWTMSVRWILRDWQAIEESAQETEPVRVQNIRRKIPSPGALSVCVLASQLSLRSFFPLLSVSKLALLSFLPPRLWKISK